MRCESDTDGFLLVALLGSFLICLLLTGVGFYHYGLFEGRFLQFSGSNLQNQGK